MQQSTKGSFDQLYNDKHVRMIHNFHCDRCDERIQY